MARRKMSIPTAEAKQLVVDRIAAGDSRFDAMRAVDRAVETFRNWKYTDSDFRLKIAAARKRATLGRVAGPRVPDFPEFCARYLRRPLPEHQLRAWDVINHRAPRTMHPAMVHSPGAYGGDYAILNFPPGHAKSTVWSVQYCVWRINRDPNIRIVIVSKTEGMAKKFLSSIQFILTNPVYQEMHTAFGPEGSWRPAGRGEGGSWREDAIYVNGRTSAEKDPTVQCFGVGSQIYGQRSDLILLDDIVDFSNAGMYEKHGDWIAQDVFSRLEDDGERDGQLLIVGTRVAPMDIYRHLRDGAKDADDQPLYTYFSQPAILEGSTGPSSGWKVLWPERLDAKKLARKKGAFTDPRRFELIYQQNDVSDDAPFPMEAVQASINRRRYEGPMHPGVPGHRTAGMQGLYVVAGLDPATVGATAIVVGGVDRHAQKRWILNCWNRRGASPQWTIETIKRVTEEYRVKEWRIERNAFQRFMTQLPEVKDYLNGRGVLLREHNTTAKNKWDPDWGVETLIPLFLGCCETAEGRLVPKADGQGPIELPRNRTDAVAELVRQLQLWEPEMSKHVPCDLVMALWFCELGMRQYLIGSTFTDTHMRSRFVSRGAVARRTVVTMDDLLAAGEWAHA